MSNLSFVPKHHREIQDGANKGTWTALPEGGRQSLMMGFTRPRGKPICIAGVAIASERKKGSNCVSKIRKFA